MKFCSNCGAEVSEKAKFCAECGTKIERKIFCTECGEELTPTQKFCPMCGTPSPAQKPAVQETAKETPLQEVDEETISLIEKLESGIFTLSFDTPDFIFNSTHIIPFRFDDGELIKYKELDEQFFEDTNINEFEEVERTDISEDLKEFSIEEIADIILTEEYCSDYNDEHDNIFDSKFTVTFYSTDKEPLVSCTKIIDFDGRLKKEPTIEDLLEGWMTLNFSTNELRGLPCTIVMNVRDKKMTTYEILTNETFSKFDVSQLVEEETSDADDVMDYTPVQIAEGILQTMERDDDIYEHRITFILYNSKQEAIYAMSRICR